MALLTRPPAAASRARWRRPLLALSAGAAVFWLLSRVDLEQSWKWIDSLGPWGPLAFCGLYAAATAGMVPGSVLTLAAGAKWGPIEGLVYVIIGSNLGANLAFGIGRFAAQAWVARLVHAHPRFSAVEQAVAAEGWKIVALLRLSPVVPFNLLNYALSLTRIRWKDYATASFLGMLPATAMFVYLGSVVDAAVRPQGRTPLEWALLAAGLAATVAVTWVVTRAARGALQSRLPSTAGESAGERTPENPDQRV